eukprot:6491761-Amphidinium_carterae.3
MVLQVDKCGVDGHPRCPVHREGTWRQVLWVLPPSRQTVTSKLQVECVGRTYQQIHHKNASSFNWWHGEGAYDPQMSHCSSTMKGQHVVIHHKSNAGLQYP